MPFIGLHAALVSWREWPLGHFAILDWTPPIPIPCASHRFHAVRLLFVGARQGLAPRWLVLAGKSLLTLVIACNRPIPALVWLISTRGSQRPDRDDPRRPQQDPGLLPDHLAAPANYDIGARHGRKRAAAGGAGAAKLIGRSTKPPCPADPTGGSHRVIAEGHGGSRVSVRHK
jgi:hypothetical protein